MNNSRAWQWRRQAVRAGCVMCRAYPVSYAQRVAYGIDIRMMQAHHIIPKRHLKQEGLKDLIWDERIALGLCGYHHARHENYRERVPRSLLPKSVYQFAEEHGLMWLLDREYPEENEQYAR